MQLGGNGVDMRHGTHGTWTWAWGHGHGHAMDMDMDVDMDMDMWNMDMVHGHMDMDMGHGGMVHDVYTNASVTVGTCRSPWVPSSVTMYRMSASTNAS